MRHELTNVEWAAIRSYKPRGIPRVDKQRVLNGIFWVLRSGAPWCDLPARLTSVKEYLGISATPGVGTNSRGGTAQ
jgi:transposase